MLDLTLADIPPVLLRETDDRARLWTVAEAARKWPGDPFQNHNRLRGLLARRLIHSRQRRGAGKTSPILLGVDDVATAETLNALLDIGISDAEVMNAASLACYSWNDKINPKPAHIICRAPFLPL